MRVLVAGTNVALGVTLTRRLLAVGHEVIGLSRTPANRDKLLVLDADYRWSARGVPGAKMADWEADEMPALAYKGHTSSLRKKMSSASCKRR